MVAASSSFSALSTFSFNYFASIISLLIMESISCFLISNLLSLLVFFVTLEPFCSCKPKNSDFTKNIKHPLQTKNAMHNLRLY